MNKPVLLGICILVFLTGPLYGWEHKGHRIVSLIAKRYIDPAVTDSLYQYLGDMTLEKASYWMDEVRMDISYDFMKPWHYVNIEKDKTYVKSKEPDIISVLENVINTLSNRKGRKRSDIELALKVLIHLMGDLHQPLHCGYPGDKGGTRTQVRFFFTATTLHSVWDNEIIEYHAINTKGCMALAEKFTAKDIEDLQKTDVMKWVGESRALLPQVYAFDGKKLDEAYVSKNAEVIKLQLLKAGIRLAGVLNQAFKGK